MTTSPPGTVMITSPASPVPSRPRRGRRRPFEPYLLIAPTVLLVTGLMVVPVVIVIAYSLFDNVVTNQNPQFVGLANYFTILTDPNFWNAVVNTVVFTVASVVIHMIIGIGFALMLNSKLVHKLPRAIFRAIYILPWIFTASVVAVLWRLLLDPSGVVNYLLQALGILHEAVPWLATPATALLAVTVINIWSGYPFFMISLLAGLQGDIGDLTNGGIHLIERAAGVRIDLHGVDEAVAHRLNARGGVGFIDAGRRIGRLWGSARFFNGLHLSRQR